MNTLKRFLFVFLIIMTIASLFSCGKSQPQKESASAVIKTTESTVTESETTDDQISYIFNQESKTLTIDGSKTHVLTRDGCREMLNTLSDSDYMAETVIITEGVKEIEADAFCNEKNIKSISLPASLSTIGRHAFSDCDNLAEITVSPNSQHFITDETGVLFSKDMTNLIFYPSALPNKKYTIPQTVTNIYSNAFCICPNLRELHLSPNLSGEFIHWFYCCDNLEKVTLPANSLNYYCDEQGLICKKDTNEIVYVPADITTLEFPENADSFFPHAMINNKFITEIVLSDTTVDIEEYLFRFPSLKEITINGTNPDYSCIDGVLYSNDKATLLWYPPMKDGKTFKVPNTVERVNFIRGKQLEKLIFSDSVKVIDSSAFYGCENLEYVHFGKSLEMFDYNDEFSVEHENVFSLCKNLQKITVDSRNKNFATDNYGALCTADMKNIITLPANGNTEKYVINNSVTRILSCFKNCVNLKKLHIGSGVEYVSVGEADTETIVGFSGCISLEEITVSEKNQNYTSIDGVLYTKDKTKLCLYPANKPCENFIIPNSVERVGDFAFLDNRNLKNIYAGTQKNSNLIFNFTNYQKGFMLPLDIYFSCEKDDFPYDFLKDNPRIHFEADGLPEN